MENNAQHATFRVIQEFPSHSGRATGHSVREDSFGGLFCTCPAADHGSSCWALKKVQADRWLAKMRLKFQESRRVKIPDMQQLIQEQWEYVLGRHDGRI